MYWNKNPAVAPKDHRGNRQNPAGQFLHGESAELNPARLNFLIFLSPCIYLPFKYRFRLSTDNRGNQQKNH